MVDAALPISRSTLRFISLRFIRRLSLPALGKVGWPRLKTVTPQMETLKFSSLKATPA